MANSYTRGSGLLEGFLAKKRTDKANSLIPGSFIKGRILDIGCGFYPYFLSKSKFSERYGVDPSLKNLKLKNLKLKNLDVTKQKLPFDDNFFNVVTMLAVFEHIDYKKLSFVLKEIKRVLKKSGIIIITTPSPWSDKLLHQMAKLELISSEEIHEHKHHYSKQKIEDIIREAGFNKNKIKSGYFELGFNMWFTARK